MTPNLYRTVFARQVPFGVVGEIESVDMNKNDVAAIRRANLKRFIKAQGWSIADLHRAAAPDQGYSGWPGLINDPNKAFGEKKARDIELALELPRGWLDEPDAPVPPNEYPDNLGAVQSPAHSLSLPTLMVASSDSLSLEQVMDAQENDTLPELFVMALPDDALGNTFRAGTEFLWISPRRKQAQVGEPVIVRDRNGKGWVRIFSEGDGDNDFIAVAKSSAYRTLYSEHDGLDVIAVWHGQVGGKFPG